MAATIVACIPAALSILTSTETDLSDRSPKFPRLDGYVVLAWSDLERAHAGLNALAPHSGSMLRALGYMMDGDRPARDGQPVTSFVLLPSPSPHRFGDQMIDVRLAARASIPFAYRRLTWVWGRLRSLPGNPAGPVPLYMLIDARAQLADKADIARFF